MKNFVTQGATLALVLTAAVVGGSLLAVGSLVGVAVTSGAIGDTVTLNLTGVYTVPKAAGTAFAQGAKLYHVAADNTVTTTATGNTFAGYAYAAAASGDTSVQILLAQ